MARQVAVSIKQHNKVIHNKYYSKKYWEYFPKQSCPNMYPKEMNDVFGHESAL